MVIFIKWWFFPVIYPTRSSHQKLTFVSRGGFPNNRPIITLEHYIDERHNADYTLTIENGVKQFEPQFYTLPKLSEGTIDIRIALGDDTNSSFTISDIQANELYKKGILIYISPGSNYFTKESLIYPDRYVNFIFGENRITYFLSGEDIAADYLLNDTGSWAWSGEAYPEWSIVTDGPRLKKLPKDISYYTKRYSGWKENEWVKSRNN